MARTLNVKHDEAPATSPLFNGFLLLAFGWLALTALFASTADARDAVAVPALVGEQ